MKKFIIVGMACALAIVTNGASFLENVSVSPFAAFDHNLERGVDYGAGLDLGYSLSKPVSIHARATSFSNEDWRGAAIDEGALLVRATLFTSNSKGARLYATGGINRQFDKDDWAMSGGLGIGLKLHKNVELLAESQPTIWLKGTKSLRTTAGLSFSF